ncbi:MAG: hypothetical protein MK135_00020 [Polyangiaceae bacterium]|nr:hypothetical protein [Polyangiaceae bacterium]
MNGRIPYFFNLTQGLVFSLLSLTGCAAEEPPPGPEEVTRLFLEKMAANHGAPAQAEEAIALLWKPARENLRRRAKRATALSGRQLRPSEMLSPSHFTLHFEPKKYEVFISEGWADVVAVGPENLRAVTRCVLEGDEWRVAVELPPLSPVRNRNDGLSL